MYVRAAGPLLARQLEHASCTVSTQGRATRRLCPASCGMQGLLLLLCALGPQEVHEVRLGLLTPYAVRTLRHLKAFFGVTFNIRPQKESQTIFLSCIGAGITNTSKAVT